METRDTKQPYAQPACGFIYYDRSVWALIRNTAGERTPSSPETISKASPLCPVICGVAVAMLRPARSRLTHAQRVQVVELMLEGHAAAAVARAVGCDYRAVQRWWTRWLQEEGENPLADAVGGRGRPRETTPEEDARILEYAERQIFCTAGEIREALHLDCSEYVIRRLVHL